MFADGKRGVRGISAPSPGMAQVSIGTDMTLLEIQTKWQTQGYIESPEIDFLIAEIKRLEEEIHGFKRKSMSPKMMGEFVSARRYQEAERLKEKR